MQVPFYQQPQFFGQPPQANVTQEVKPVIEVEEVKQEDVNDEAREVSNGMIEVLQKSENPKHRNSKFLKFLKKLSHGAYAIENEQLVKVPEKLQEFRLLEGERLKEEAGRQQVEESKGGVMQGDAGGISEERQAQFSKLWNNDENLDED